VVGKYPAIAGGREIRRWKSIGGLSLYAGQLGGAMTSRESAATSNNLGLRRQCYSRGRLGEMQSYICSSTDRKVDRMDFSANISKLKIYFFT
jgi:hypothetical protein